MAETVFSRAQVVAMERAAARAWPALETADVEGWAWRCSGGGTRRANSVLPLAFSGASLDAAIDGVEARYGAKGLKAYFQVSSIAEPPGLDARLAARGYTYEEPCLLLAKPLTATPMPAGVDILREASADWFAIYAEQIDAVRRAAVPATLARVPEPRAFLLFRRDGAPLATALGVVSPDGVALVECVATRANGRRTGAAQIVMDALECWAPAQGATVAALQVVEGNTQARALYARRGYVEAGRYHYRWKVG